MVILRLELYHLLLRQPRGWSHESRQVLCLWRRRDELVLVLRVDDLLRDPRRHHHLYHFVLLLLAGWWQQLWLLKYHLLLLLRRMLHGEDLMLDWGHWRPHELGTRRDHWTRRWHRRDVGKHW